MSVSESIIIAASFCLVLFRLHSKETCVRSKTVPSARVADVNELCVIVDVADLFTLSLRRRKCAHVLCLRRECMDQDQGNDC